jgi:hypothetical protein
VMIVVISLVTTVPVLFFVFKMIGGLHKAAADEQRLLMTGAAATGQILFVQQTGMYVNNQPQVSIGVMVYPPGGQPYQAQVTKIVSLFETSHYQVGAQVGIRYDPANPGRVAIAPQQMMAPMPMQQPMQPPMGGYPPPGGAPPPGGYPPPGFGG